MDDDLCSNYWTWSPDPNIQKEEFFNFFSQGRSKTNTNFCYRKWFQSDEKNCQQKNVISNSSDACKEDNETMWTVMGRYLNKMKIWKKAQKHEISLQKDNKCKQIVCRSKRDRGANNSLRTRNLRTCDDRPFSKVQNYEIQFQNDNNCRPKADHDAKYLILIRDLGTCEDRIFSETQNYEITLQNYNDCKQIICRPNTDCDARDSTRSRDFRTCEDRPSSGTVVIMLRVPNDVNGCQKENDCKQALICQPDDQIYVNCDAGNSIYSSIFNCKPIECQPKTNLNTRDSIASIEFRTCEDPLFSEAQTNSKDKCSGDENDADKASLMQQLCDCKEEIRKMRREERVMLKKMKKANALLIREEYIKFEQF